MALGVKRDVWVKGARVWREGAARKALPATSDLGERCRESPELLVQANRSTKLMLSCNATSMDTAVLFFRIFFPF